MSFHNNHDCNCSDYTSSLPQIPPQTFIKLNRLNKQSVIDSKSEDFTAKKYIKRSTLHIQKSKYYNRKALMVQQMLRIDQIHKKIQLAHKMRDRAIQILQQKKQIVEDWKMKRVKTNKNSKTGNIADNFKTKY